MAETKNFLCVVFSIRVENRQFYVINAKVGDSMENTNWRWTNFYFWLPHTVNVYVQLEREKNTDNCLFFVNSNAPSVLHFSFVSDTGL